MKHLKNLEISKLQQYTLSIPSEASYMQEDFITSPSNEAAKKWIDLWPEWQGSIYPRISYIYGPTGCGKTHLAKIWQSHSCAKQITKLDLRKLNYHSDANSYLLEDIEEFLREEITLLHFLNYIIEQNKFLLITAKTSAYDLSLKLPDLTSRLHAIKSYQIFEPTTILAEQMLVKIFSDMQIMVNEEVVKYLSNRIQRSYNAIKQTVEILNKASLEQNKKITIPLVKEVLNY